MSIINSTYETLTVHNVNNKTAAIIKVAAKELTELWGNKKLQVTLDGVTSVFENEDLSESNELKELLDKASEAKEFSYSISFSNKYGLDLREDSELFKLFTEDADVKDNVVFKSIEDYDTHAYIGSYVYCDSAHGEVCHTDSQPDFSNVDSFYAYSPTLLVAAEELKEDEEIHKVALSKVNKILSYCTFNMNGAPFEDNWKDYGELVLQAGLEITPAQLNGFIAAVQDLSDYADTVEGLDLKFEFGFRSNGPDMFALVYISEIRDEDDALDGVQVEYAKF